MKIFKIALVFMLVCSAAEVSRGDTSKVLTPAATPVIIAGVTPVVADPFMIVTGSYNPVLSLSTSTSPTAAVLSPTAVVTVVATPNAVSGTATPVAVSGTATPVVSGTATPIVEGALWPASRSEMWRTRHAQHFSLLPTDTNP